MKTFKEFLAESQMNEVKISNTHALKYFKLIQKAIGSRTMETDLVKDVLEVKYDTVSLFFKEGYLVGFRDEDGETYEVSKSLRTVKDLKSVRDIQKHLGAPKAPERMTIPTQTIVDGNYEVQDAKAATSKLKTLGEFLKELDTVKRKANGVVDVDQDYKHYVSQKAVWINLGGFHIDEKGAISEAKLNVKRYFSDFVETRSERKSGDIFVYPAKEEYKHLINSLHFSIQEYELDENDVEREGFPPGTEVAYSASGLFTMPGWNWYKI